MRELSYFAKPCYITVLFCNTAESLLRPTHPTTLASSKAISAESLTTKEPSRVPMTTVRVQQSTTNTHVTTKQQLTTGTQVTTAQQSATDTHVTTYSAHQITSTLLHHNHDNRTKTASVAPYGSAHKGDDGYFDVHIFVMPYSTFRCGQLSLLNSFEEPGARALENLLRDWSKSIGVGEAGEERGWVISF